MAKDKKDKMNELQLTDKELNAVITALGLNTCMYWLGDHYALAEEAREINFSKSDVQALKRATKKAKELL